MKLVLIGYMASGKSAVGKILAQKIGADFIDLDAYIEDRESHTISEIFRNKGEIYFRKIEAIYLTELLEEFDQIVIATGGGTPCYGNNLVQINQNGKSYYLKASVKTLSNRLKAELNHRPLVADLEPDKIEEFVAKHLFERAPFYEKAEHIITVDNKDIPAIVAEILK